MSSSSGAPFRKRARAQTSGGIVSPAQADRFYKGCVGPVQGKGKEIGMRERQDVLALALELLPISAVGFDGRSVPITDANDRARLFPLLYPEADLCRTLSSFIATVDPESVRQFVPSLTSDIIRSVSQTLMKQGDIQSVGRLQSLSREYESIVSDEARRRYQRPLTDYLRQAIEFAIAQRVAQPGNDLTMAFGEPLEDQFGNDWNLLEFVYDDANNAWGWLPRANLTGDEAYEWMNIFQQAAGPGNWGYIAPSAMYPFGFSQLSSEGLARAMAATLMAYPEETLHFSPLQPAVLTDPAINQTAKTLFRTVEPVEDGFLLTAETLTMPELWRKFKGL